ncbi:MAG: creatininase family protein [Thermoproteota archaeon]|nr:creatininase family protein [Thermoproteota archaeon]
MKVFEMNDHEIRSFRNKVEQVLIPVGSLEQHGEHLPVSTDSIIVEYLANMISKKIPSLVLPAIIYGVSHEHKPLFNISISSSALSNTLSDVCVSLIENGLNNVIILNGHHGNAGLLQYIPQIVERTIFQNSNIYSINYWQLLDREFDHAGYVETSLVLAIRPQLVNMKKARKGKQDDTLLRVATSSFLNKPSSFTKITKSGVWGDPSHASANEGKKMLNHIIGNALTVIRQLNDLSKR